VKYLSGASTSNHREVSGSAPCGGEQAVSTPVWAVVSGYLRTRADSLPSTEQARAVRCSVAVSAGAGGKQAAMRAIALPLSSPAEGRVAEQIPPLCDVLGPRIAMPLCSGVSSRCRCLMRWLARGVRSSEVRNPCSAPGSICASERVVCCSVAWLGCLGGDGPLG